MSLGVPANEVGFECDTIAGDHPKIAEEFRLYFADFATMKSSLPDPSTPSGGSPDRSRQPVSRRRFLRLLGYATGGLGVAAGGPMVHPWLSAVAQPATGWITPAPEIAANPGDGIRVGLLHSRSGVMALSEAGALEAELVAIAEINRQGGVLGKRIQPAIEDGASDWPTFQEKVKKLITREQVATIFGGWTSSSRKAMLPTLESKNHMLWYPVYYEGQECSKNIFYTGMLPNQQVEPAVTWMVSKFAKQPIFLVGSDYVFPRAVNTVIKTQLHSQSQSRSVVGEDYLPLGDTDVRDLVRKIKTRMPKGGMIFNGLVGDTNVAFFAQLTRMKLTPEQYPTVSFSIGEDDALAIGADYMDGHYLARSYFDTLNTLASAKFVKAFRTRYGSRRRVNDVMQSAYVAVYLWKQAVEQAGTAMDLELVRAAAIGQRFAAPEGNIELTKNHHVTKPARIAQVRRDGQIAIVYETKEMIAPQPWSQRIRVTQGFACDWSDPARGEKYKV
jgi:urea transport system substrate-binding protein